MRITIALMAYMYLKYSMYVDLYGDDEWALVVALIACLIQDLLEIINRLERIFR